MIYSEKRKNNLNRLKQNLFSQSRKWELFKTAQDNQIFLKRLNEKQSFYNTKKWEKDYEKSQNYKKNICVYPSLTFDTIKDDNYSKERKFYITQKIKLSESTSKNMDMVSDDELVGDPKDRTKKFLFSKQGTIKDMNCFISFYVEDKK